MIWQAYVDGLTILNVLIVIKTYLEQNTIDQEIDRNPIRPSSQLYRDSVNNQNKYGESIDIA